MTSISVPDCLSAIEAISFLISLAYSVISYPAGPVRRHTVSEGYESKGSDEVFDYIPFVQADDITSVASLVTAARTISPYTSSPDVKSQRLTIGSAQ